jgi:hypothetical protein
MDIIFPSKFTSAQNIDPTIKKNIKCSPIVCSF